RLRISLLRIFDRSVLGRDQACPRDFSRSRVMGKTDGARNGAKFLLGRSSAALRAALPRTSRSERRSSSVDVDLTTVTGKFGGRRQKCPRINIGRRRQMSAAKSANHSNLCYLRTRLSERRLVLA